MIGNKNMGKSGDQAGSAFFSSARWALPAILTLFILTSISYIWLTPHFEGPDEWQHFSYIRWLAEGKGFPPQGNAAFQTDVEQEAGQSPLYYLIASLPAYLIGFDEAQAVYRENPYAFSRVGENIQPDNDNVAIHYPGDGQPLKGGWLVLYVARLISMIFGVVLIICVYGLTREIFPETVELALIAALLTAVIPQVVFISSVASNDVPAAALSALTLWMLAILIRRGPTPIRALGLGVAFGLALLAKTSTIFLALPIAAGFIYLWLADRRRVRDIIKYGLITAFATLIISGWWFLRSSLLYRSPLGLETHDLTSWAIGNPTGKLFSPLTRWRFVIESFWISLGWGTIRPSIWIYRLLKIVSAISLIGLFVGLIRYTRRGKLRVNVTSALLAILFIAILAGIFALEMWMRRVVASYGRLMFPALAAIVVLLSLGWYKIHPKLPYIIIGLLALFSLSTPFWLLIPAFSPPQPLDAVAVAALPPSIGWRFGLSEDKPIAELISATPTEKTVFVDDTLTIEVCWKALNQSDKPYTVLVHIVGPENQLVTNRRTYPGLGHYPTTIWQPETVFCDNVTLPVWDSLPKTLVYQIEIGLLDKETETRLAIFDRTGNEVAGGFVSQVRLATDEPPKIYKPANLVEADSLELVDFQAPGRWKIGEPMNIKLDWGVAAQIDQDYQVYVHLRDQATQENVAQADGPPLEGWYPTSWWPVGEIITDEREFQLATEIEPGTYDLYAGFYDLVSGERFGSDNYLGEVVLQP